MGKKHKDACVQCECSLEGDSAEQDVNNEVGRMTRSVDSRRLLSPAVMPNVLMNKVARMLSLSFK